LRPVQSEQGFPYSGVMPAARTTLPSARFPPGQISRGTPGRGARAGRSPGRGPRGACAAPVVEHVVHRLRHLLHDRVRVPFGKNKAFHTLASTPARPCSPLVARSGMTEERFAAITAMPSRCPPSRAPPRSGWCCTCSRCARRSGPEAPALPRGRGCG